MASCAVLKHCLTHSLVYILSYPKGACGDINPQAGRATDPDNLAHYGTRLTQLLTPILDRACQHMSANVKTQGSEIFCSGMESVSDSVMLQYAPLPSKEEVESEVGGKFRF